MSQRLIFSYHSSALLYSQLSFIRTLRDSKYLVRNKFYEYSNIRILKKNIKKYALKYFLAICGRLLKIVVKYSKDLKVLTHIC